MKNHSSQTLFLVYGFIDGSLLIHKFIYSFIFSDLYIYNIFNPFSATRRLKPHQNKVKVEGFVKYLISSLIFYFFSQFYEKVQ